MGSLITYKRIPMKNAGKNASKSMFRVSDGNSFLSASVILFGAKENNVTMQLFRIFECYVPLLYLVHFGIFKMQRFVYEIFETLQQRLGFAGDFHQANILVRIE